MFILIFGLILLAVSVSISRQENPLSKLGGPLRIGAIVVIVIGLSTAMFKVIDAGQVGVKTLFGKVDNDVLYSGLNIINPLVEVTNFDVKTQNYTMSGVLDEGMKSGDDAIRVLSADGLEVIIDLSVLYKVKASETPRILKEIGRDYVDKIVRPVSRTAIRDNAVYYDAVALYSSKRQEFQDKIYKTIGESFEKRGLELEQLLVRNITLPESVKKTIESKINAEQEAQKMTFVLQKERQEAERKRVEAQGIADYQRILSTGLSDKQLQYEAIKAQKELAQSPNAKIIVMGSGKSVPIMISGN